MDAYWPQRPERWTEGENAEWPATSGQLPPSRPEEDTQPLSRTNIRWRDVPPPASLPAPTGPPPPASLPPPAGIPGPAGDPTPTGGFTPANDGASADVPRYDPDRFLEGLVATSYRRALEIGRAVYIQGPWPRIALYPTSYTAIVAGGHDSLRAYAGEQDLPARAELIFTPAPQYNINHPDMVSLDILLWKLALGASRGRLPLGTALDTPYILQEWPNFTRLIVTPGGMSIAALWARQAYSISQIIHLLGLPPGDVFAFYSAAAAIDLVHPAAPPPPAPASGSVAPETPAAYPAPAAPPAPPTNPGPAVNPGPATNPGPGAYQASRPRVLPDSPAQNAITPTPRRSLLRKLFDRLRTP